MRRRLHVAASMLEMMGRNSLTTWVLLSASCFWVKECICALECSWLARVLPFVKRVLKLNVRETSEDLSTDRGTNRVILLVVLVAPLDHSDTMASLSAVSVLLNEPFVDRLSLLHLRVSCRLRSNRRIVVGV